MLVLDNPTAHCACCGRQFPAADIARHLDDCASRQEAAAKADGGRRKRQKLYHLRVGAHTGHVLHLEVRGNALLEDLDQYLRHIWLECCGHMSGLLIDGTFYTPEIFAEDAPEEGEETMDVEVARVFKPGMAMRYEYDFGSTTELEIRVVGEREGRATTARPVALLARNDHKPPPCEACDREAALICLQCQYDGDAAQALVCEAHSRRHRKHDDYGAPMPIVNSPRTGVCGYVGPALPPY